MHATPVSQPADALPAPGQIVRVRSRQYLVEEVVPPPEPHQQALVRLSCLEDDAQGQPLEVLWEREVDATRVEGHLAHAVARRGFDSPRSFSAYLHVLRWSCVTATDPRLFQAPYRAGIEVMAWQLEPLRKALLLPRVNLFIADDVGLGKTIEAGLILRELILRQKVRRVVVACPPSVVLQWREELESRFGLTFQVFDRAFVQARRRERGWAVNPWTTHPRFIISHALLREEEYAGPLRDWLGSFCPGSLLILDEAHNAAPASGERYAVDSLLTRAVRDLAPLFEHRLFLSATPHNGHSNSFAALLELLDPQRFCRGVPVRSEKVLEAVMVRRLKSDLRQVVGGLPERQVLQLDIGDLPPDSPELRLPELLAEYARRREERLASAPRSRRAAAALVLTSLQKRLLSSLEAFACTLRVHRRAVERQAAEPAPAPPPPTEATLPLLLEAPGSDDERAELPEAEVQAEEEAQLEAASLAGSGPQEALAEELRLLEAMGQLAEEARARPDARVLRLLAWIREHMCPGLPRPGQRPQGEPAAWNERRLLIFTEYADTRRYLEQQLASVLSLTERGEERLACLHGGMDDQSREEVQRAFNTDPARHPLRILIATDAAREGVNLQAWCADLFHFDIPWNPSRMEQRNGRIDRKLQRSPQVRCHYFVYTQRREDRVLQALVRKTETIQRELGSLSPVVERRLAGLLERGIRPGLAEQLAQEIAAAQEQGSARAVVEQELEVARERQERLAGQLETLRELLEKAREALGLEARHFREAVSRGLELLGAPPLRCLDPDPSQPGARFEFPALDRQDGLEASWADTLDTLRPPRRREQKPWEWRKQAPLRPVIFSDSGRLDGEGVHLHLEHRVVQRLFSRFLSQGFAQGALSRACVVHTREALPRVVLLGRLSLFGDGAARLHDELVQVAARWVDPDARGSAMKPYAEATEQQTLALMEEALAQAQEVPEPVRVRLLSTVQRDVEALQPALLERAEERYSRAVERLATRGEREAREMRAILESQRERIERQAREHEAQAAQLAFDFPEAERRQLEADRRHWARRLKELAEELEREPERIRRVYEVRARRVEPVGLVYLWPVSG